MRKIILILLLILIGLLNLSCGMINESGVNNGDSSDVTVIKESSLEKLQIGMPMSEVLSIIGHDYSVFTGTVYPFVFTWEIEGGRTLTAVFKIDGCENQNDFFDLVNGVTNPDPEEIREITSDELKELRSLVSSAKLVCAYYDKDHNLSIFK